MNIGPQRIATNFEILQGSYFSASHKLADGFICLESRVFPDVGWNYGYTTKTQETISKEISAEIRNALPNLSPYLVYTENQNLDFSEFALHQPVDFGVWMSCEKNPARTTDNSDIRFDVFGPLDHSCISAAVEIFCDAYCNFLPNQPGYNDLEPYYPSGFEYFLRTAPRNHTIIASVDSECAAVASVVLHPSGQTAGIYNIGVRPRFRKKKIGNAISRKATSLAFELGASLCILQTEKDTPVQHLYETIGYATDFNLLAMPLEN